jgi:dTDP-4-amino-4,6-dideoxygalactose transaminase
MEEKKLSKCMMPLHTLLTDEDVEYIFDCLKTALKEINP